MSRIPEPMTPPEPSPRQRSHGGHPSFFLPLLLIAVGVLLLLSNLGYLPWSAWDTLWRLWPVALIALGLDVLIGRRSALGALFSGVLVLVLVGVIVGVVVSVQELPQAGQTYVEYPLGTATRAEVSLEWGSQASQLRAMNDAARLIAADAGDQGHLQLEAHTEGDRAIVALKVEPGWWPLRLFRAQPPTPERVNVSLNAGIPLDLRISASSGATDLDLSQLQLSQLRVDAGSGAMNLMLPETTSGLLRARIEGGSGHLTINLPAGLGARLRVARGSGSLQVDQRLRMIQGSQDDREVYESAGFESADQRLQLEIEQSSGAITIRSS